jgi:hypothetical protein
VKVHVHSDPADAGLGLPGHIRARSADGLNAVEISLRYDPATGPARAILALAHAAIEVLVHARAVKAPEPVSREAEGSRWNG